MSILDLYPFNLRRMWCMLPGILILVTPHLSAQYKAEDFRVALLQTDYGALILFNGKTNSFSLKVGGKSVLPLDKPNFITADSILFQSTVIPFTEQKNFAHLTADEKKDLLLDYRLYEKEYIEAQLHIRLKETVELTDINGQPFLYWSFKMPPDNTSVGQQIYLITICYDQMVVLNAPIPHGRTEAPAKDLFLRIAQTLELNTGHTYDINKLYYTLRPARLAPPFMLPVPEGWSAAINPLPMESASLIPFTGEEHQRMAPAWQEPGNPNAWTYASLWWIKDDAIITQKTLESYLWDYYNGLIIRNVINRNMDPKNIVPTVVNLKEQKPEAPDKSKFEGTVKMLDYLTGKPIILNLTAHILVCTKDKKLGVLFLVSPQPATHTLWKTLNAMHHDFQCSAASSK